MLGAPIPGVPGGVAVDRTSPLWQALVREVVEMFAKRREDAEKAATLTEDTEA